MCSKFSFIFQKRLFFKGLSHSEIEFDHELFTELSLTPMHSPNIRFQFWNPRCDASVFPGSDNDADDHTFLYNILWAPRGRYFDFAFWFRLGAERTYVIL